MKKLKQFLISKIDKPKLFIALNKFIFCKILEYHTPIIKNNGKHCSFCGKGIDGI